MKLQRMLVQLAACVAVAVAVNLQAADATGDWGWTTPGRNGGEPRKTSLKLKVEGEKLTGEMTSPGRQGGEPTKVAITEGKVKGAELSFTVVREWNGNKMSSKYKGKLEGDTIKGKISMDRNGEAVERDWEAKREAAKK